MYQTCKALYVLNSTFFYEFYVTKYHDHDLRHAHKRITFDRHQIHQENPLRNHVVIVFMYSYALATFRQSPIKLIRHWSYHPYIQKVILRNFSHAVCTLFLRKQSTRT